MAKARTPRVEGSLLLRSADSIGRLIGSLQREIDDVAARVRGNGAVPAGRRNAKRTAAGERRTAGEAGRAEPGSTPARSKARAPAPAAARKKKRAKQSRK